MMLQSAERMLALQFRVAKLSFEAGESVRHGLSGIFLGSAVAQPPAGQRGAEGEGQNNSDQKCRRCHGLPLVCHTSSLSKFSLCGRRSTDPLSPCGTPA